MMSSRLRVLVCGYRRWALDTFTQLLEQRNESPKNSNLSNSDIFLVQDGAAFETLATSNVVWDIIVLVGWSWKVQVDIVNKTLVIGMHPSELPKYAGGSPIQNQILDGLDSSVATMFRLTENFDEGDILLQEPYSLKDSLDNVFKELTRVSVSMIVKTINNHPNHEMIPQKSISGGFSRKRLKPEDSKLTHESLSMKSARQLYDFIRCRTDPYPNVFLEDETGKLVFKAVEFIPK